MGLFPKAAEFLGIKKFGQGIASAARTITGGVGQDIAAQQQADAMNQKLLYVARQEQDPEKKRRLLELAQRNGGSITPQQIDPGIDLTNKEILGSAANTALNIAAPGAFKGGKAAVIGKNALTGAGFGAAQGLEKNRDTKGIVGSTLGGAAIGGGVGAAGLMAKAAKDFVGTKVPTWMMNKAVKPALQDLKKNVKFGTKTLGQELLEEGVKGGPKKLLEIADNKLTSLEDDLQRVLSDPNLAEAQIRRDAVFPALRELIAHKKQVPGGSRDLIKIKGVYDELPQNMTLVEANEIKRAIYRELRDPAYKLDAKLTTKSEALKAIARGLKTEIENTVGGTVVSDINRKLSIYGRLENSMVDQLAREMRNNGISLTDAVLLAGGDTTSILALLRHVGQNTETQIAQGLSKVSKVGTGTVGKAVKAATKRAALNAP
jgi:hypothetical protein